ncbi:hypothetical protein HYPSUDRAFT_517570 [Hypholoma sublateritium FD-334 SS-4]|uniref:Uncharacterized protein n=1 Tax=Hypholoma sublateritium (strain FD-334 SS-4) TaxID=945553 RepID=A0A0D2LMV6_HYPSF|nr:hypothetical protein HYPSUDRAFT_517570 [Hypholoma sublateritium FD-334 SS-4]
MTLFRTIIYDLTTLLLTLSISSDMVKCGPKLPSPSRRELERIEKENKRIAQIESGVVPVSLGEPRANSFYLPPLGKKRRVKRTEPATIEESQRKRAKKQKRALARRNAKAMVKEALARLTAGSQAKVAGSKGDSADNDGLGISASGGIPATGRSTLEVPIAIIHTPLLTKSDHESGVEANSSNSSDLIPGWALLKSATKSWRSGKTMDQDLGLGLSPGMLGLDLGQNSGNNSNTLVTSTPRLDVKIPTGTESGSFFDNETFVSGPSKQIDATQEVKILDGQSSPERHRVHLPSRNPFLGFVHRFGLGSEPPARFSFRAPPHASPVSKTAIFSEPLDYSKYSSKRSSSAYSSVRSQSEVVHKRAAEQPIAEASDLQCLLPVAPQPSSLAESGLMRANLTQPLLPILSFGTSVASKAPGATVFKFDEAPEKARVGGPSIIRLGVETPPVAARVSAPAKLPSLSDAAVKNGFYAPGPSISSRAPLFNDENPPAVTPGKITTPVRMENSRVREANRPPPIGYNHTAVVTHWVTPNHAREQNSGQIVNSGSFSSNISSVRGSAQAAPDGPTESMDANGQVENAHTGKSASHVLKFPASPNLTLRPLAPAAPIIHKTSHTRIVTERDIHSPRSVILNDLEKGSCGGNLNSESTDGVERTSPLLSPTFNIRQPDGLTTCPDTPPWGSRSGIVPPASTPVSRSPRIFAIALPTPPWSRAPILPTHGPHITDSQANGGREAGGMRGFVLALKWALKKTIDYLWQRRA